jgi:hypothetical protein
MSISTESCYECGRDIPEGLGEPLYACLWSMPRGGATYWGWVQVCPSCGIGLRHRRQALLVGFSLFVAALTALTALVLLP